MSTEPEYFDSQASAAAILGIGIDDIRQAKRDGCSAFRSGRVYRAELLAWFASPRATERTVAGDDGCEVWPDRGEALRALMFTLERAHEQRALKLGEYVRLAQATMPHVIALAKLWEVEEFDAAGFRKCWNETLSETVARATLRNERSRKESR